MLIHIAFQLGLLHVRAQQLHEDDLQGADRGRARRRRVGAADVSGKVILPLCRPALAALATLEFTFIYNDFFWALVLMKTGDRRPITSALNNLQGQFFTDNNLLAAGALIVAMPTHRRLLRPVQRQFVRGLTLGSTKG